MQVEIRTEECMVLEIEGHRSVLTREQVESLYRHLTNWLGKDGDGPAPAPDEDNTEIERLTAEMDRLLRILADLRHDLWRSSPAPRYLPFPFPYQSPEKLIVTCGEE